MATSSVRRVSIVMPIEYGYNREVLRGVSRFVYEGRQWIFSVAGQLDNSYEPGIRDWQPHGIIAHVSSPVMVEFFQRLNIPLVNVSGALPETPFARVGGDDLEVGRVAAKHFLDRGFRNLAFVGYGGHKYSRDRSEGYRQQAKAAGIKVIDYGEPPKGQTSNTQNMLVTWIKSLPKPVAILGCSDRRTLQLAILCYQSGIRVPDDVALLGVDDDDLACDLAFPRLSSVAIAGEQIGYEAARVLEIMMDGGKRPVRPLILPPLGVVTRQSTDTLAVDDPDVAAALRFIRHKAREPIGVPDILKAVPVSRRVLERRFRATLQRSPQEEIQRYRLELAKDLLTRTTLRVSDVAERCGFGSVHRFIVAFRATTGTTPETFRQALLGKKQFVAKRT